MGNPFLSNVLYPGLSDSRRGFLEAFKTPSKRARRTPAEILDPEEIGDIVV
jgi:hypothetical protein